MKDMSTVGNAASAPKSKTGLGGKEVYTGRGSWETADNGGVVVRASMQKKQETGRDQYCSTYCDDRTFVFASPEEGAAKVRELMALPEGSEIPDGGGASGAAAPAPTSGGY